MVRECRCVLERRAHVGDGAGAGGFASDWLGYWKHLLICLGWLLLATGAAAQTARTLHAVAYGQIAVSAPTSGEWREPPLCWLDVAELSEAPRRALEWIPAAPGEVSQTVWVQLPAGAIASCCNSARCGRHDAVRVEVR
jgi:hypothetical protein